MIIITTPTGHIGSQVLQKLLYKNEKIRVIARDPSKLTPEVRAKVEVIVGSLDDAEAVNKAYEGADQLFYVVPPSMQYSDVNGYYLKFAQITCAAIKQQGIKRVVFVSGTGLGYEKKAGAVSASYLAVQAIEATDAAVRILHCGTFMENLLHSVQPIKYKGQFGTPVPPEIKLPWVATQDIADAAVRLLMDASWSGKGAVGVLGPQDLSYGEVAEIISEVTGQAVHYQEIPADAMKATVMQYGATDAAAQGLVDIYLSMKKEVFNRVERTAESSSPTTFRAWCGEVFKPAFLK